MRRLGPSTRAFLTTLIFFQGSGEGSDPTWGHTTRRRLFQADPVFFPDPDSTVFRVVKAEEIDNARVAFENAGLKGHHVHPIAHGGPGIPPAGGLAFTGESRVKASDLKGLD